MFTNEQVVTVYGCVCGLYLQWSCGNREWASVESSVTSRDSCGYPPYSLVTCKLKATNNAGESTEQTGTARSSCGGKLIARILEVIKKQYFCTSLFDIRNNIA